MAVSNAYRDFRLQCRIERKAAERIEVGMDDCVLAFCKRSATLPHIGAHRSFIRLKFDNTAAQVEDFFINERFIIPVHKKIKLHAASIYVAVIVHYYRIDATDNGFSDNLGNSDRVCTMSRLMHCFL